MGASQGSAHCQCSDADMDLAWHALHCRVGSFLPGWFLSASMCTSLILQQFPAACDLVDGCGGEAILWVWEHFGVLLMPPWHTFPIAAVSNKA